jgi:uncharacterized membrane protein YvbJ
MIIAICKNCGTKKWGAFNQCKHCGFEPKIENELAESMFLTDHYFDKNTLKEISLAFQAGKSPKIDKHKKY